MAPVAMASAAIATCMAYLALCADHTDAPDRMLANKIYMLRHEQKVSKQINDSGAET